MAGAPRIAIRSHGSAMSAMSPPSAINRSSGTAAASITATTSTPIPTASQVACTPSPTADPRSPAPKNRAARAVVPYDRNVSCEATSDRINPPIAKPARLSAPRRPTTARSNSR